LFINLIIIYLIIYFIIATSAPIERIFSGGVDLIAPKRCAMKGNTIRECMCLKNWWKNGFCKDSNIVTED